MFTPALNPTYAAVSIGLLAVVGDLLHRVVPFYRRELQVESVTRLVPLDGLRGILCFGVMYHHAAIEHAFLITHVWEETPSVFYVLLGQTSVALFFCITGFLFWSRAISRDGNIPIWSFLRGRWFRIVPLYLFTCIAALWLVHHNIHWTRRTSHGHHALNRSTLEGIGRMALMGLRPWKALDGLDINMVNGGVTWTLQYEWAFYLALPALALVIRGGAWRMVFLVLAWWVTVGLDQDADYKAFFLTGILAAHVARWPRTSAMLRTSVVSILVIAVAIGMPLLVAGGYGWLPLLLTSLIFIPIACGNSLFGILNLSGLRLMGTISYSVYLLHGMFLYRGRGILFRILPRGDMHYWAAVFVMACCVLLVCSATYRFIEWPAIQFEKGLRRQPGLKETPKPA